MGGGPESQINTWNFVRKIAHFFKKKIKCSKQPKKQNKPNFHFSLSGVANVRGGWVGFDVWDKIPKKNNISFGTFPNCVVLIENSVQVKTRLPSSEPSSSFLSSSLSPFSGGYHYTFLYHKKVKISVYHII